MTSLNTAAPSTCPNASERVRVARVNGVEVHYTDTGVGATTILLHGGMGDLGSWQHQIRALSPRYRVVAYSRRRSHPNRNADSACVRFVNCLDDDVDDLLALQGLLQAGPAHLVGTSYGALVALAVALRAPDKVASLVLVEPPLHRWACATAAGEQLYAAFIDGVWRAAAEAFTRGLQRVAMQLLTDGMWGRPVFGSWTDDRIASAMRNAEAMKALTQSIDPFPDIARSAVASLKMPMLLVQGERSSALHRLVMNELGDLMRDARRAEIPLAGHGSPSENPDEFNAVVLKFLDPLRHAAGDPP
jgi:pimeloyl-ACP methyl ester carboxylesterase